MAALDAGCHDMFTWRTSTRQNGVGPGEVADVHVLDVNGVRLTIAIARDAHVSADDVATLQSIVDSVQFD